MQSYLFLICYFSICLTHAVAYRLQSHKPVQNVAFQQCFKDRRAEINSLYQFNFSILFLSTIMVFCPIQNTQVHAAEYTAENQLYSVHVTDDMELSPKLVKTHDEETFFKSKDVKGLSFGVTVDRIKLNNIKDFTTPEGLGKRLVAVEKSKEGVFDVKLGSCAESFKSPCKLSNAPEYLIDYSVDSSRGKNHYYTATTIVDHKLIVATVQMKEDSTAEFEPIAKEILESFQINS